MRRSVLVFTAALIGVLSGCGGSTADAVAGSGTHPTTGGSASSVSTVMVMNNIYSPDNLTVAVGQAVTWKWDTCGGDGYGGMACSDHSVAFSDGSASPTQSSGSFTRSFNAAGTFTYHCSIHGTLMTGTIVVK